MRPHRRQPTRLPRPWDSPGKNTGVGCHFLLQCMKVKSESEVAQSCLTLSNPMDCSPPGSSIHGIFQARVLEWGAIAFSAHHDKETHLVLKTHRHPEIESEDMEKDFSKLRVKKKGSSIREKIYFKLKMVMRQKSSHNEKRASLSRRFNNHKYLYPISEHLKL